VAASGRESLQGTRREAHIFILDSTLLFFFRFPEHRSCHVMSLGMQAFYTITLQCAVRQKINPVDVVDLTRIRSGHFSLWYALGKKHTPEPSGHSGEEKKLGLNRNLGKMSRLCMKGC
jgi:hypothetical protein